MAQGEKRENSVLFSLRELRQIEESRVQEEEHAVRSAEEARVRAQQEDERRRREAEDARVQAERDHVRSIEESRLAQEREARMRVESAEATERAAAWSGQENRDPRRRCVGKLGRHLPQLHQSCGTDVHEKNAARC